MLVLDFFLTQTNGTPEKKQFRYKKEHFVQIKSSVDDSLQPAYFVRSPNKKRPLLISLHTWGGTYKQTDSLYLFAIEQDWNYIHPEYGGYQWKDNSCCYPRSLHDIDDAIQFAIENSDADTGKIVLIGKSGGASGVLGAFLTSKYRNLICFAWSPITDHVQWYKDVKNDSVLKEKYLKKILAGTHSVGDSLNEAEAKQKSVQYLAVDSFTQFKNSRLILYAGILDGIKGSTSIIQPINFYNKILTAWRVPDSSCYVDTREKSILLNQRKGMYALSDSIGNRKILHHEKYKNIELFLFDGEHEIILKHVYETLKKIDDKR